jgi:predicted nucleotidyltransferase
MKASLVNKLQRFFPAYPIEKAWVFGSYARGEENGKSDIDIMVRFEKDARISLLDLVGVKLDLENTLHKKVDLVTEGGILKFAREAIDNDKILIYER